MKDGLQFTRGIATEDNYDRIEVECEVSSYSGDVGVTLRTEAQGSPSQRIHMSRDEFNQVMDAVRAFDTMRATLPPGEAGRAA